MKQFLVQVRRRYERLRYEQLPVANLLRLEAPPDGTTGGEPPQVLDLQSSVSRCDEFVVAPRRSRLKLRTRLRPNAFFSSWIGAWSGQPAVEFLVEVWSGGETYRLACIPVAPCRSNPKTLQRVNADLSRFARQEITLFLSIKADETAEESIVGWGDPKILRRRGLQEYWIQAQTRLAEGGLKSLAESVEALLKGNPVPLSLFADYPHWVKEHTVTDTQRAQMKVSVASFHHKPLISILTPTFNTDPQVLRRCIQSVQAQIYSNWELCINDDGSTRDGLLDVLSEYAKHDSRIKLRLSSQNEGIARATNAALRMASGVFIALLDHDDELSPDALLENVKLLQEHPEADVIYSDEDKLEMNGGYSEPFFKPDWSPDLLLSYMYTCHFSLYRRNLVEDLGGFRPGFEGSQDYDLILRVSERTEKIFHIPKILYHWRKSPDSTCATPLAKLRTADAGLRALEEHMQRIGVEAEVLPTDRPNRYRVIPVIRGNPLVSIIIPHRERVARLRKCLTSIASHTSYHNYEIVIVDNGSSTAEARQFLSSQPWPVIHFEEPFNYSRMNNLAARQCEGEYLLFLHDDTEVISPDWLRALLGYAQLPEVGAVGGKLYYDDGTIQHAGIILGLNGVAGHWLRRSPGNSLGYFSSLSSTRNVSAITSACMLVKRKAFDCVGRFDERLAVGFHHLDLCLKLRQAGYRIVWVPEAELYHYQDGRITEELVANELHYFKNKWAPGFLQDPYYNPNLSLDTETLALRF